MPIRCLLLVALCAASMHLCADAPSDRAAVDRVARRALELYAAGDLDGMVALWRPDAAALPSFRQRVEWLVRKRCQTLRSVSVPSVSVDGDRAAADVDALITTRSRASAERLEQYFVTLELVRSGDGWLLTGWTRREDALADAIESARSDGDRRAVLQRESQRVTPYLAGALCARALVAANQGRFADASALNRLARGIAEELGSVAGEADATGIDSVLARRAAHDGDASVRLAGDALAMAERSGDPDVIGRALLRMSRALPAKEGYERVMSMADDISEPRIVAMAASQLSKFYSDGHDYRTGMRYALIGRAAAEASGDAFARISIEMNLGGASFWQSDYESAAAHYRLAATLAREAGAPEMAAGDLGIVASCARRLGRGEDLLRATEQALALLTEADPDDEKSSLLDERAWYYATIGDFGHAEEDVQAALRHSAPDAWRGSYDHALLTLAHLRFTEKRYNEALDALSRAGLGAHTDNFEAALIHAGALRHLGRREEARRILRETLSVTQNWRAALAGNESLLQNYMEHHIEAYIELVDMLVDDGRVDEALSVAEEAKGGMLLDVLRGGRTFAEEQLQPDEHREQTKIERRVTTANAAALSSRHSEASMVELRAARAELESFRAGLYAKYPILKAQSQTASPATRAQMASMLPDRSEAFVEYVVTESRLHAFVVRRQGNTVAVHVHTIAIGRKELERRLRSLLARVASIDLRFTAEARRLYDVLVAPIAIDLHGVTTIGFIPDGALWQIPFESLVAGDGHFLIERAACFYAPSITVCFEMQAKQRSRARAPGEFLAFANPPVPQSSEIRVTAKLRDHEYQALPEAEREVETVARMYDPERTHVYTGPRALEQRAKEESGNFDVLHFATHGVLDDRNPMYSHLLLAPSLRGGVPTDDGLLETWEMMRLNLHAQLAVLSACDTARGSVHEGEGLIGMSWALFVAGCSSTIVTEWSVSSTAAEEVVVDFYRQWRRMKAGSPFAKAEALRWARLRLMRDGRHRHPFYWAAFVLVGSPQSAR